MKKCCPVLFVISVAMCGFLFGCGGGSGKSGDDGNVSLSGQQVSLLGEGRMLFQLQFSGQKVDVVKMDGTEVVCLYHDEDYTYQFNIGENTGVLNITPAAGSLAFCAMEGVTIAFDAAGRNTGVITSGTITEEGGDDLDPSMEGIPRSMAGWTWNVSRE